MPERDGVGVKSIEVGARVLQALIESRFLSVTALAEKTRMTPGKVHRYLVSFIRSGLVEQNPETKLYTLGPTAFQLGIIAISRSDPIRRALSLQRAVRDLTGETVVLSVWGGGGPTIIHVEESFHPVIVTMKLGACLPLLGTAAGLTFAAFMPAIATDSLIREGLRGSGAELAEASQALQDLLARIRRERISVKSGHLEPGVKAIAAPLLTPQGNLIAVMAVVTSEEGCRDGDSVAAVLRDKTSEFNDWPMAASDS